MRGRRLINLLSGGTALPPWVINGVNPPDIAFDWKNNRVWSKGKGVTQASSLITCSRGSAGTAPDVNGNYVQFGANIPRITSAGLLVEESRTNSIRNNSMQGAVVQADNVELTTNGNFASQGAGWTVGTASGGSVVFATGSVTLIGDPSDLMNYISQQVTGLIVGRSYVISVAGTNAFVAGGVGTGPGFFDIAGPTSLSGNGTNITAPDRFAFTATASSAWITIARQGNTPTVVTSVSVQDGQRVENGGFTTNPINAAQSTVQNGWQWTNSAGTGTAVYNGSNLVTLTGGNNAIYFGTAALPTIPGCTYTVSADVSVGTVLPQVGTTSIGFDLGGFGLNVGTAQKFQFTATTTTSYLTFKAGAGTSTAIANVSVQSAGAQPTNWAIANSLPSGFFAQVIGTGTAQGINYIDIRYFGTSSGGNFFPTFDVGSFAASAGQTWTASAFVALVGGSLANVSSFFLASNYTPSGNLAVGFTPNATLTRLSASGTTPSGTTAIGGSFFNIGVASGAVDFTLRIGWPQLENNSLINSTVASAVKAANGASGVNGTAVYSVGGGTGTAATLNVTWAAGVLTVNSVANPGSYTTFPPSPATLTYVSGTATGWTGATVTLTPTDNSASAFATSPIITSGAAATRAADVITLTSPPAFGSAYSLYASGTPQAPTGYTIAQSFIDLTNGTSTEFGSFRVTGGTGTFFATGAPSWNPSAGAVSQGLISRTAAATAAGAQTAALNGALAAAGTIAASPVVTNARIGYSLSGANFFDGLLSYTALWASQAIPQAQLQSMTASGP